MLFYNFSKYLLACFPISPSFAFSVFILLASIFFSLPIFLVTVFTKKYYIFSNTQVIDITCYKCQLFFFFPAKKYISGVLTVVQQIQPLAWHGGLRTWPCRLLQASLRTWREISKRPQRQHRVTDNMQKPKQVIDIDPKGVRS